MAEALRSIIEVSGHDRGAKATSIFMQATRGSQDDSIGTYYFAEVSRQADAILKVFMEGGFAQQPNLRPIVDVVRYFYATYLSRSALEAIAKLLKQHCEQTDLQLLKNQTLQARD